jgi:hypothetical protein
VSPESKHYHFLGGISELAPSTLKAFCNVDGSNAIAFIATAGESGGEIEIGISRYAATVNNDVKEMSITIAVEWQHKEQGTLLAQQLINYAKSHCVKNFIQWTLLIILICNNSPITLA